MPATATSRLKVTATFLLPHSADSDITLAISLGESLGNHERLLPLRTALPTLTPISRARSTDSYGNDGLWYAGTRGAQCEPSHILPLRDTPPQSPDGPDARFETLLETHMEDGYLPSSGSSPFSQAGTVKKHFNTTVTTPEAAATTTIDYPMLPGSFNAQYSRNRRIYRENRPVTTSHAYVDGLQAALNSHRGLASPTNSLSSWCNQLYS